VPPPSWTINAHHNHGHGREVVLWTPAFVTLKQTESTKEGKLRPQRHRNGRRRWTMRSGPTLVIPLLGEPWSAEFDLPEGAQEIYALLSRRLCVRNNNNKRKKKKDRTSIQTVHDTRVEAFFSARAEKIFSHDFLFFILRNSPALPRETQNRSQPHTQ
jgi:hypothetical protein